MRIRIKVPQRMKLRPRNRSKKKFRIKALQLMRHRQKNRSKKLLISVGMLKVNRMTKKEM